MNKLEKSAIAISFVLLLCVGSVAYFVQSNRNKTVGSQKAQVKQVAIKANSADELRNLESSRIASENLYQKLVEHRAINILIVGDDIGNSSDVDDQDKWENVLADQLNQKYHSTFSVNTLSESSSNIVEGWINYNKYISKNSSSQFDLVFLCFGQYDQSQVELKEFHMLYEKLLRQIMATQPKAEIIPIIENALPNNNGYATDIKDLASYYGLTVANLASAFQQNKNQSFLSKDNVHPSNAGYQEYASLIANIIEKGVDTSKTISYAQKGYCFLDTSKVENFKFINISNNVHGFTTKDDIYVTENNDSTISFSGSGSIIYIYYKGQADGGIFQVYLDGKYEAEVNTKSSVSSNQIYMIQGNVIGGNHEVKIVSKSGTINVFGAIMNQ